MSRALIPAAVAALASLTLAAPAESASGPNRVSWTPCFGTLQCASVDVPLDYGRPRGPTISIALTRLPASDPQRRIGSLFINPGGPGGSGVGFVADLGSRLFTPEVRARFDLVGFDPRGIQRSSPLRCFGSEAEWDPFFLPFAFPLTGEETRQWITADRFLTGACRRDGGPIIDHMSTANTARDLDVLRRAVGDDKLTYAGYSYGSFLGQVYANLFPDRVRAVVLDGVVDPIAWTTGRGLERFFVPFSTRLRPFAGGRAALQEFFRLCDAGGPRCAFSGGAANRYDALAKRIREAPIPFTFPDGTTGTLDYSNLVAITQGPLGHPGLWPLLAQILADAAAGSSARAAPLRLDARAHRLLRQPPFAPPQAVDGSPVVEDYVNELEGFPGVACSDGENPRNYAAWSISGALADAQFGYFGRLWTWYSSLCAEWPGFDRDRYLGPFNRVTGNPVLVVGNRFDPTTRYESAQLVDTLLPRSELLTIEGWGHTSLFLSACADSVIARYLIDVVAATITCRPDTVPFTTD